MPKIDILSKVRELDVIRPLPAAAVKLMQACQDREGNILALVELIESDPGIAATIVSTANSPLYGQSRMIDSIQQAVVILGFRNIAQIATVVATESVFVQGDALAEAKKQLFMHCLACASVARILASKAGNVDPGAAFLAGVLHDVGKLAFLELIGNPYLELTKNRSFEEIPGIEHDFFGVDHQQIGTMCAEKWGLPEDIVTAIGFHHHPESASVHQSTAFITQAADRCSIRWGLSDDRPIPLDLPDNPLGIELDESTEKQLLEQAKLEFERLATSCT